MREDSKVMTYDVRDFETFVGIDVSKKELVVSMRLPKADSKLRWRFANTANGRSRLARKIHREAAGKALCCYEAGVCGHVLQRDLEAHGVACIVIAPSLVPVKPGERVKTDRRDADKLADCLAADGLSEVFPPTPEEEGARDLCRARAAAMDDLTACRHRVLKLLLRYGIVFTEGKLHWTLRHMKWLRQVELGSPNAQYALDDSLLALEQLEARLRSLETAIAGLAESEPYREAVGILCCFRGIALISAMTILTEIYNIGRFPDAEKLMAYLGLVPSERSSGEKTSRGPITKAGNSRARKILIESGHHYRRRIGISAKLKSRREGQPAWAVAMADKAMHRLHDRFWHLVLGGGKPTNVAVVAVARELVGFLWAALVELELRQARTRAA